MGIVNSLQAASVDHSVRTYTMKTIYLILGRHALMVALLAFCGTGNTQEVSTFLRDVIRGSTEGRIQLEHRIYHLGIARELAYRTLLLNRCSNFRESVADPRFDAFSEAILNDMSSPDPNVLTIFTATGRLEDATIQDALTDDQIAIIRRIMKSRHYGDFIEYLTFERAATEIAGGFEDVNTGNKAPWIAVSALSYLRQSKFFALLLSNINAEDRALLNRRDLDGLPSIINSPVDDEYLKELTAFFVRQLDTAFLRKRLHIETRFLLTLYNTLGIDAMRGAAVLSADIPPAERASCKSRNFANCINTQWLKTAITKKKQLEETQYENAARIMRNGFSDLCKLNPK